MRYLPPDAQARELHDTPEVRRILINLALYQGVVNGERANARQDVIADLQRQVLIAALDSVISDLTNSLGTSGTLRQVSFRRLAEIERAIQRMQARKAR